jgi:hypothetical protein
MLGDVDDQANESANVSEMINSGAGNDSIHAAVGASIASAKTPNMNKNNMG